MSDADITTALQEKGWPPEQIRQCLAGRVRPARPSPIEVRRALGEALSVIAHAPGRFLLLGCAAGLLAAVGVAISDLGRFMIITGFLALVPLIVVPVTFFAPPFLWLCRMSLQVLGKKEPQLPSRKQLWTVLRTALLAGLMSGLALSLFLAPALVNYWSDPAEPLELRMMNGLISLIFGMPLIVAAVYLLALPSLFVVFPAIADGVEPVDAFVMSFRRGIQNMKVLLGLELIVTAVSGLLGVGFVLVGHAVIGSVLTAGAETIEAHIVRATLVTLEAGVFVPWLAALA
ncbi:MAG: hypothetical protein R6V19_11105, partial [Armatimonadota bacterium]